MASSKPYRIPTPSIPQAANGYDAQPKKRLSSRIPSMLSKSNNTDTSEDHLSRELTRASTRSSSKRRWWRILWFRGMYNDIRRRLPFYWSDWIDAWDYRVIPATVYMYFAKYVHINRARSLNAQLILQFSPCATRHSPDLHDSILPALAFSLDMFTKTNSSFGVNEVLLSSVLGSVVFSFLAAQPLVIVGVTGTSLRESKVNDTVADSEKAPSQSSTTPFTTSLHPAEPTTLPSCAGLACKRLSHGDRFPTETCTDGPS